MVVTVLIAVAAVMGIAGLIITWETERLRQETARYRAVLRELQDAEARKTLAEERQLREWWG